MPSFIADGYEFGSGIKPIDMVHDGIEFFHRPMTPVDSANYQHEAGRENGERLREIQAEWLMRKLVRWQLPEDKNGNRPQPPKLCKQVFLKPVSKDDVTIDQVLMSQMVEVVIWGAAPDYRLTETDEDAVKN